MYESIGASLDRARGYTVKLSSHRNTVSGLHVEFNVYMRIVVNRWRKCVKSIAGLTLNEFRVLEALSDTSSMRVQDIADLLIMTRSQVSVCKKQLSELGLVREANNPGDARSVLVEATQEGNNLVMKLLPLLNDITAFAHAIESDEGIMVLRAWHSRMYYNLKQYSQKNT
jgi:DNA-binding MarR family transcriptional regulator